MNQEPTSSAIRVSVALCACNGARHLRQQLDSIQRQTRAVDEIVICDDASDDDTVAVINAFADLSPLPIKLEQNPRRLGVTKNFEKAISLCTGGIIFLCDQDDLWRSDKVRLTLDALNQSKAGLAFSNAEVVHEDLSPAGYRLWDSVWFDCAERRQVEQGNAVPVLLRHAVAAGSTLAFRSEFLPLILPIPDLPHSHDIWITLLIACVSRLHPIGEDLIRYRLHTANHVGLRRHSLLGQLKMARQQIRTQAFGYAANLHQAAYDRLASPAAASWNIDPEIPMVLQEKIRHSRLRHQLPQSWPSRFSVIGGELRNGNYRKYSYGFKSVLQDLILR